MYRTVSFPCFRLHRQLLTRCYLHDPIPRSPPQVPAVDVAAPAVEADVSVPEVSADVAVPDVAAPAADVTARSVEVPDVPSVDKVAAEVDAKVDEVVAEVSSNPGLCAFLSSKYC